MVRLNLGLSRKFIFGCLFLDLQIRISFIIEPFRLRIDIQLNLFDEEKVNGAYCIAHISVRLSSTNSYKYLKVTRLLH